MEEKKRLIIIDSNSLLHRAFHALPPLTTKKGEQTGAVYGFLLILFKAIKDLQSNHIVACFDTKAPTFRHEKFKGYKAQRPRTPQEILNQLPKIKEILEVFKIPIFAKEGFEADDLIATISKKAEEYDNLSEIYILSGDLDNLQLVNEKTKVYTLGKGIKDTVLYDKNRVITRFGVEPKQMNDFKALTGDPSDNIPGVAGIGKKTAADLIKQFETIENLYKEIGEGMANIKTRTKDLLLDNKEKAYLSKELVKTKRDVDIQFVFEDCKFGNFDQKEVENIFRELEFNTLVTRLSSIIYHH
ncbi:MAG: 5'-3' exonuclease H3TH domain-containing protein [bacterium]|nr:5'-3' exonuclease H3TH domain-containing protein [bacterium]